MTAITLHLPDDLAARLAQLPPDELNAGAARLLADLVRSSHNSNRDENVDGYLSKPEPAAIRDGIGRGLAHSRAGRVTPFAEWAARKLEQLEQLEQEDQHTQ
jgi:predicted transcriptional regulator